MNPELTEALNVTQHIVIRSKSKRLGAEKQRLVAALESGVVDARKRHEAMEVALVRARHKMESVLRRAQGGRGGGGVARLAGQQQQQQQQHENHSAAATRALLETEIYHRNASLESARSAAAVMANKLARARKDATRSAAYFREWIAASAKRGQGIERHLASKIKDRDEHRRVRFEQWK